MKKILSSLLLLAAVSVKSQNNLVVFSENGEKFYLVVNGVKQNINPETNVKVTDLIQPNYKVRIEFDQKNKGVVNQNVFLSDGGEPVKNQEFVYSLKLTGKGAYKLRMVSVAPADNSSNQTANQTIVHYTTTEPVANTSSNDNVSGGNVSISQTTTQTTVNTGNVGNNNNASVGINMSGVGVNININDNTGAVNGSSSTTVTSTTVTTTSSSSGIPSEQVSYGSTYNQGKPKNNSNNAVNPVKNPQYVPGYNGPIGCPVPMSVADFDKLKSSISTKSFEDSKLKIAKQVIDNNCLTCQQVKDIMLMFNFEANRLDFAKYSYGHTYDIGNYYQLNDAFTFESSITELDNYIKTKKK